ncbi:biogenesis of lysosome-related organelles complex 1 subunit 4-like isoform X2 [Antedon mediterranea]|uniref:biogenesis of lysosome-related organelles complex 1 subunit 4-like isoform X2 n=1 Tax=Antedon mediterranea TaxID=105859 RepID=UPI003AF89A4A
MASVSEVKEAEREGVVLTTDEIVEETALDYSQYFITDSTKDIRSESSISLNHCLPEITTKMNQIKEVFQQIDQLEAFVSMVKDNVCTMEEQVIQAEKDLGGMKSLKGFFNSIPLFAQKSSVPKTTVVKKYCQPEIFETKDYFPDS